MKKVQMSPRLAPGVGEWYGEHFPNRNAGGEYVLAAWPPLYDRTLFELEGRFTRGELMLIVDVFNSTALTSAMAGQEIFLQVQDGIDLDKLDQKWEVDRKTILEKLLDLPIFSRAVLTLWANGYWYGQPEKDLANLEEYVKVMI
jgi:hypothetical protein